MNGGVLIRSVISEKAMREAATGKFTFEVRRSASKGEIALEVKRAFGVEVVAVQTSIVKARGRKSLRTRRKMAIATGKKAVVSLAPGQKIDLFDVTEDKVKS